MTNSAWWSVTTVSGGAYDSATGSLIANVAGGPIEISIGGPGLEGGLSQLSDTFAPISIEKDGFPVGTMTSVEVDANGMVRAFFDNGATRTIFQVPLVDLPYYLPKALGSALRMTGLRRQFPWGPEFPGMRDMMRTHSLIEACAFQWRQCVENSIKAFEAMPQNKSLFERSTLH